MSYFGSNKFVDQERESLQKLLGRELGPEFLSERVGPGGVKLKYIDAGSLINLANEVFEFNGWSHSIISQTIDYMDDVGGKYNVGISTAVRVTIKDGTYHEDIGYGCIENCRQKGMALEKAKKESVTDALKRALRHYGNVLGNCVYNKSYLKAISRIGQPPKQQLDAANLYRSDTKANILHQTKPIPNIPKPADEVDEYLDDIGDDAFRTADLECLPAQYLVDESIDLNYRLDELTRPVHTDSSVKQLVANQSEVKQGIHQLHKSKTVQILPKTPPKLTARSTSLVASSTAIDMVYPQHNLVQQQNTRMVPTSSESNRHQPYPPRTNATLNSNCNNPPALQEYNGQKGYGIKQAMNRPVLPPGQRLQKSASATNVNQQDLNIPGFT